MRESRVITKVFGTLSDSRLLVPVPTTPGHPQQRLHILAAQAFIKMSEAAQKDLGFPLLCASGWRPHRWDSWEQYVSFVTKKYGSLKEGQKWLAFDSPHETGLACDMGCGGLEPKKATIPQQLKTPLYKWLDQNEYLYGWSDYSREPWHKEYNIPLANYKSGMLSTIDALNDNLGPYYTDPCDDFMCVEAPDDKSE